jgi:beta-lactamase regulating signal transducer with metallopeptidase domain
MNSLASLGGIGLLAWGGLAALWFASRPPSTGRPAARYHALFLLLVLASLAPMISQVARILLEQRLVPKGVGRAVLTATEIDLGTRSTVDPIAVGLASLGAVWLVAMMVGAFSAIRRLAESRRIIRNGAPLSEEAQARMERLARELGISTPKVVLSDEDCLPFVSAWPQACVVIPSPLVEALSPDALDLVLRHELLHLARGDHQGAIALGLLRIPFTFHPLAKRLCEEIDLAREMAVDERIGATSPHAYARTLVDVAQLHRFGAREAEVALRPTSLVRRIQMLTQPSLHRPVRWLPQLFAALTLAAVGMLFPRVNASAEEQEDSVIQLSAQETKTMTFHDLDRIAIKEPAIADIETAEKDKLVLLGVKPGETTMALWFKDKRKLIYRIVVK